MKLTLELYNTKYSIETNRNDYGAHELIEMFSRMLVQATFPPSVILPADGGHFECEYKEDEQ